MGARIVRPVVIAVAIAVLAQVAPRSVASQEDVWVDLSRQLPHDLFNRAVAPPPWPSLHERLLTPAAPAGSPPPGVKAPLWGGSVTNRGPIVYRESVNGVVLIAARNGIGTGALISSAGDIITNAHVVERSHRARGQEWMAVWIKPAEAARAGRDNFLLGRIVHKDLQRDLALVRLVNAPPPTAKIIPLATVIPEIGQPVFAIGHPKTLLWSFIQGIVSQVRAEHRWSYADNVPRMGTAIQTQAPVNPGNSGGPLLNEDGFMVGVVVGSPSESEGIFFAVAVQHVHELLTRVR